MMKQNITIGIKFIMISFLFINSIFLYSQEKDEEIKDGLSVNEENIEEMPAESSITDFPSDSEEDSPSVDKAKPFLKFESFHVFLNNNLIFGLSLEEAFGFGSTITFQYTLDFNLSLGLETGYYGIKSEIDENNNSIVGGFSLIPIFIMVDYNIKLLDNFYITPVLKVGISYASARINGWYGGHTFAGIFEGGVRVKAYLGDGFLIQGNILYTGLIENSGIVSLLSVGFGFGF